MISLRAFIQNVCIVMSCIVVGLDALPGPEIVKNVIGNAKKGSLKGSFFPPDDEMRDLLVELIDREQEKIQISAFRFTEKVVAEAVLRAHRRGVVVEIIIDADGVGRFSRVRKLHSKGVAVYVYPAVGERKEYSLEHGKFLVFYNVALTKKTSKKVLWTGSLNLTAAAFEKNQEHVLVIDDEELIRPCCEQFERLKARSTRL